MGGGSGGKRAIGYRLNLVSYELFFFFFHFRNLSHSARRGEEGGGLTVTRFEGKAHKCLPLAPALL